MGKRELLLILGFVVLGAIVYQITAPPPRPGEGGMSVGRILADARRAVHGNRGRAEVTHTSTRPVGSSTTELRLLGPLGEVTIQGEDRTDVACEFHVTSTGFDDAEARALADRSTLTIDQAAGSMTLQVDFPREGRQTGALVVKAPRRLRVRLEQSGSRTSISNVASAEVVSARGETTLKQVAGRVALNQRGGRVTIEDAEAVRVTSRGGGDLRISRVGGEVSLELQGGELAAADLGGPIDIESRSTDIELRAGKSRGPIRLNTSGGSVTVLDVRGELRIDGRNAEVDVTMADGAGSIAIYGDGGEPIRVTPPPGGYQLDAVARDGRITVPDDTVAASTDGTGQRASGRVRAGGPTVTIRSGHGDIIVRGR